MQPGQMSPYGSLNWVAAELGSWLSQPPVPVTQVLAVQGHMHSHLYNTHFYIHSLRISVAIGLYVCFVYEAVLTLVLYSFEGIQWAKWPDEVLREFRRRMFCTFWRAKYDPIGSLKSAFLV